MEPLIWLTKLVGYGLAVYRLTHLFVYERGPGDVFDWIRAKAGITVTETVVYTSPWDYSAAEAGGEVHESVEGKGFFAELLMCPLCLSVWFSALAALCLYWGNKVADLVATWLALAGVSLILFNREDDA